MRSPDRRLNPNEDQYLKLIEKVIHKGKERDNRTGISGSALFGEMMTFDLQKGFPLLTTKKMAWKSLVQELLWFIKGDTSAKRLSEKGCKIWNANSSREFLDQRRLGGYAEGDCGPIYGFQWRHFGAEYIDCDEDYTGKGIDQLANCIRLIKEEPNSRRIVMSAWNPVDLQAMVLPPCHMSVQFQVEDRRLNAILYQRSADVALGVPFNIASYALLVHMIAHVTGLFPGKFVHMLGDVHIYNNHNTGLYKQLQRSPLAPPKLQLNPKITNIDDFTEEDIRLLDYEHHELIKFKMAV